MRQINAHALTVTAVFMALMAAWFVGMFERNFWTPDEPREAALAVSMRQAGDHSLPRLGGDAFAEKPPLTYWMAAGAMNHFGERPFAARLPNLLYALLALAAVTLLGRSAGGAMCGGVAGVTFATFLLIYQTQIWLACDAAQLAGVSIALLGAFNALRAIRSAERTAWYALMQSGLALAFFAKNLSAWMVPLSAWLAMVIWERRWREFCRWELWVTGLIPVCLILWWVGALLQRPDHDAVLRSLFWYNLAGRAISIAAISHGEFGAGHRNWPGKYWVELPVYVLPWTALVISAARSAFSQSRQDSASRFAWRFAISAVLPGLLALSFATSARGVYAAPTLLGIALMIGLWAQLSDGAVPGSAEHRALQITSLLIGFISVALLALLAAGLFFLPHIIPFPRALAAGAAGIVALAVCIQAMHRPSALLPTILRLGAAHALLLAGGLYAIAGIVNRWQDLSVIANQAQTIVQRDRLVLWQPDETTIAWADLYLPTPPARVFQESSGLTSVAIAAYLETDPHAHVLALAPRRRWTRGDWRDYLKNGVDQQGTTVLDGLRRDFETLHSKVEYYYERPGGRAYVMLHRRIGAQLDKSGR